MPRYPFACGTCGAEFDVDREADDLARPVACPLDGEAARRVYGVAPAGGGRRAAAVPFGTYWHDHGPGTEAHLHSIQEQATDPQSAAQQPIAEQAVEDRRGANR